MVKKYKLGIAEGDTHSELWSDAIKKIGLALPANDDPNIGRQIRFKNWKPKMGLVRQGILTITERQRVWGYDENNEYTMIDGYRAYTPEYDTTIPLSLGEVEFV
jgi:hypothetical protein